ncbi:MAG TPA: hypothetical protein VE842_17415, partial [Pyrinomonadaceae bacterium]|nr:hypothetical protein [Pyrinomonadaceae bacterium]
LQNMLCRLKRRIPISHVLRYGIQLSDIFSQIHAAGWVWRDCKPINILVTPEGTLRPVDFEGACPVDQPDPMLWGTPGFSPPEGRDHNPQTGAHYDLYALGSMLYLLLTGIVPEATGPLPIEKLRPHVPSEVRRLVTRLLSHSPERRPCAERVARGLKAALPLYERREVARHSVSVQLETGRDALKGSDRRRARKPSRRRSQTHISSAAAAAG